MSVAQNATPKQAQTILRKLAPFMSSMQVTRGSELVLPACFLFAWVHVPGVRAWSRIQRISLVAQIPQAEGIHILSPDVHPHMMSLITLLLLKPIRQEAMDDRGNQVNPYARLFLDSAVITGQKRRHTLTNPYDAFPEAWQHYWTS